MSKEEFVKGLKVLGNAYGTSYTREDCELWYEFLGEYSYETFKKTIKKFIKTSKFAPKIADIVQGCEEEKVNEKILIVEYMNSRGYFKQAAEKDKAIMFIGKNNIPQWLQEDIKKYESEWKNDKLLENKGQTLLEG